MFYSLNVSLVKQSSSEKNKGENNKRLKTQVRQGLTKGWMTKPWAKTGPIAQET